LNRSSARCWAVQAGRDCSRRQRHASSIGSRATSGRSVRARASNPPRMQESLSSSFVVVLAVVVVVVGNDSQQAAGQKVSFCVPGAPEVRGQSRHSPQHPAAATLAAARFRQPGGAGHFGGGGERAASPWSRRPAARERLGSNLGSGWQGRQLARGVSAAQKAHCSIRSAKIGLAHCARSCAGATAGYQVCGPRDLQTARQGLSTPHRVSQQARPAEGRRFRAVSRATATDTTRTTSTTSCLLLLLAATAAVLRHQQSACDHAAWPEQGFEAVRPPRSLTGGREGFLVRDRPPTTRAAPALSQVAVQAADVNGSRPRSAVQRRAALFAKRLPDFEAAALQPPLQSLRAPPSAAGPVSQLAVCRSREIRRPPIHPDSIAAQSLRLQVEGAAALDSPYRYHEAVESAAEDG